MKHCKSFLLLLLSFIVIGTMLLPVNAEQVFLTASYDHGFLTVNGPEEGIFLIYVDGTPSGQYIGNGQTNVSFEIKFKPGTHTISLRNLQLTEVTAFTLDYEGEKIILPSGLTNIEPMAFLNDSSITQIVLPDTLLSIQEKSFLGTSISSVSLPPSLTFIADDAFNSPFKMTMTAEKGTYAYEWAVKNGYIQEVPENYPTVINPYDFNGAEVWIADYWTSANWDANTDMTKEQEATYNYRRWIESTFNCTVKTMSDGDWSTNVKQLINFCSAPDGSYRLYILPPDFIATPMANNLLAAWQGDMTDEHWNAAAVNFMTRSGNVYGVCTGYSEPRPCLFFNKRVLEEAGIDWNTIYDMQADGTWTWNAFEAMLSRITRDIDNDGVIDIYGLTGSNMDLYLEGVFSNGGTFFDYDQNGKLVITADNDAVIEGMQWAKDIWNNYGYQQPADGQWDYYKYAWKEGFCGFYMYQAYGGFNDNSEMADMADEWGCVAFPMGKLNNYIGYVSQNLTVIPNVYTSAEVRGMVELYRLWTLATPGYSSKNSWIGNKYNYTDERAVEETYAMLRQPEHQLWNKSLFIGSLNEVLGADFMWNLGSSDPAALVKAKIPIWQAMLDNFNGN